MCKQTDLFGLQETHGSLPDAMEFARLAGGAKCFSAWSAVGMDVVDFLDENLVFGSSSAPGASEHVMPLEGKRDTYDQVNGVLGLPLLNPAVRQSARNTAETQTLYRVPAVAFLISSSERHSRSLPHASTGPLSLVGA